MRGQLLHLSGPRRGRTDTLEQGDVSIGSDPAADVRYPAGLGVAPRHAVLAFDDCGCDFSIRAAEGRVFVDHREVEEVILRDGDLLELGAGGPKARFRVWHGNGRACKPVRTMLGDAAAVGRESGLVASGSTLVRDLLTHATLTLKIGFPVLVVGALALAFASGWFGGGRAKAHHVEEQVAELRDELADLRAERVGRVTREELDSLREELAVRAAEIERLATVRETVRTVLAVHSRGVCLIHGVWGLRLPESMRTPGQTFLSELDGDRTEFEYTGSGFHVGGGRIVTNRHVALPWENARELEEMLRRGLEPVMFRLSATFPGHPPIAVDRSTIAVRAADRIDVAVLRAELPPEVPALELDDRPAAELSGETVLVVGYPTGVSALLAKAGESVAHAILDDADGDLGRIIAGLAASDAIWPTVTRGVLSEVRETRLVYDAETTVGGSGGPVLGADGRVLGVNFAILIGFGGSNFGVPVRHVLELLE